MTSNGKQFKIPHIFKNISFDEERGKLELFSETKEFFNVPWRIKLKQKSSYLGIYLQHLIDQEGDWLVDVDITLKLVATTGKQFGDRIQHVFKRNSCTTSMGTPTLMKVKDVKKSYLIDGNLMIEAIVRINEMEGIEKKNLRCFDESMKHCSDVALVLNGQKFFVSKLTLAYQSSYFEGMFLRTFEESKKSEVELDGIDPKDFQNFLELLYGEPSVNDETVDGILKLIDMFDAKLALQKCENFLIQESKKELKEKFQMAYQFKMEKLRDSCLSEVKTVQILRSVLTCDLEEMDPFVVRELLKISLQKHSFDY